ncbi:SPFH domain-containing protein [Streptomyces sp. NPDC056831]|uniref:SPFH domain-containing protein n=1 Tax=Streptomyces sp. NPDC056831 TaxID=3345954 RepID=UPI0036B78E78
MGAGVAVVVVATAPALLKSSLRVVKQYEHGVVYRFGRVKSAPAEPGPLLLVPFLDRMTKVTMQIVTLPVPAQEGITRRLSPTLGGDAEGADRGRNSRCATACWAGAAGPTVMSGTAPNRAVRVAVVNRASRVGCAGSRVR